MKLYGEKEIGSILKRATENSEPDRSDPSVGLSIDELRQLAADAGIDPDQITRAVAELDLESEKIEQTFLGGPFSFDSQIMVEGEITVGEWEEMLMSVRKTFKSEGTVNTRDSVLEWRSPWGTTNSAQVTAVKEDGRTKIGVSWNGPLTALPFYIPVPLAAIASLLFASEFLELGAVPGLSFVLLATGVTFFTGRWALSRHLNKLFSRFRQMMVGFELASMRSDGNTELGSSQTDSSTGMAQTREPILKLDERVGDDDPHVEPRGRDRTRE